MLNEESSSTLKLFFLFDSDHSFSLCLIRWFGRKSDVVWKRYVGLVKRRKLYAINWPSPKLLSEFLFDSCARDSTPFPAPLPRQLPRGAGAVDPISAQSLLSE